MFSSAVELSALQGFLKLDDTNLEDNFYQCDMNLTANV